MVFVYKHPCPIGHNEYWVVDAEPNDIMPPPPNGQWARPEPLDGPIGRFLLPIGGGALLRVLLHFIFI